jgi:valyl-tRNA synthetase
MRGKQLPKPAKIISQENDSQGLTYQFIIPF